MKLKYYFMKSISINYLFVIAFLALLTSCSNQPLIYMYSDGNNNTYKVTSEKKMFYEPMTPEMSSSGIYSGGNPMEISLDTEDFNNITEHFNSLLKNKSIHINKRLMGSGMIKLVYSGNKTEIVNLDGNAKEIEDFEKMLNELKK